MKPKVRLLSAFTLVEIMIVVAIIGMLAAIAIPSFKRAIEDARRRTCQANLRQIEGVKMRWALDQHRELTLTPTDEDLFGPNGLICDKPQCPSGGSYLLNSGETKPACSVADHTY